MSLRILFADDSMTAQSMGKKILTEAGYEVIAVSNGAAAVKKIAEQKPDIIILDVYMPGYSGLEVCEKVRGSMETTKTPVLLTVGKMEPYRAEDGNRVRADGVIVKPFEASDLLAIVKKLEERIRQAALVEQAVFAERFHPGAPETSAELAVEPAEPVTSSTAQPTVEVPDHMASSSAFSDLLGAEPARSAFPADIAPPLPSAHDAPVEPPPPPPPRPQTSVPDYELPVSWRQEQETKPERELSAPAVTQPETALSEPEPAPAPAPPVASRPLQIPVYQERPETASSVDLVPTAAPPTGDLEIAREPYLQESAADTTRNTIVESTEPGLLPTRQQYMPPASLSDVEAAELAAVDAEFPTGSFHDIPAEIALHAPPPDHTEVIPAPTLAAEPTAGLEADKPKLSDADFEARVAAAMAAYSPGVAPPSMGRTPVAEGAATEPPAETQVETIAGGAAPTSGEPQPSVPAFEYHPPVGMAEQALPPEVAPYSSQPETEATPAPAESVTAPPVATSETQDAATAEPETAPLAVAAAAGAGAASDHHAISQAVHRVMERLKPELVEEILRELKSKE